MDGDDRRQKDSLSGTQTRVALSGEREDGAPSFVHAPSGDLPELEAEGKRLRMVLGDAWGVAAPVETATRTIYADAMLDPGASLPLPKDHADRGVDMPAGSVDVAGGAVEAGRMTASAPAIARRSAPGGARLMMPGGDRLGGPRHIRWTFVASSKDRIDAAREAWRAGDWADGRFRLPPGDDAEHIPLPDK